MKTARHDVLSYGFGVLLIVSAIRLFWTTSADGRTDLTFVAAIALIVIGVATGTLAGLLGVGGGVIMIPAMVLLLGEMNVMAKGTSLAVIIPTSITGTIRNRKTANVDVKA
ncbi:MAG: TSUP family transporter, partial [Actinomycetota bacterium]